MVVLLAVEFFATQAGEALLLGQFPRAHVVGVGDAPDDEGHVGVVADEVDDDFLSDAWQLDGAVLVSHPGG